MSYSDWDPDDLLDFDYGKSVSNKTSTSKKPEPRHSEFSWDENKATHRDYDDDIRLYEKYRQQSAEEIIQQARFEAQEEVFEKYTNKKQNNKKRRKSTSTSATAKAAAKKNFALKNKGTKLYKFSKVLSLFYIVALGAFAFVMLIMNILPFYLLIAMYVVLGLLSLIIVIQLTKNNIKRWAKVLSTTMAIILIIFYGVGCAYGLGTLSFLSKTSVKNESKVGKISKDPFNVVMTGMDVNGTIDEQGRSDVNMVVTVNPNTATILMTSIPRDYEIRMPDKGYAMDKLTHTGFYSVDTTIGAEEDLLNIKANYYVKVNFTTVKKFINAVGGIDVYSEYEFNPVKRSWWTVKKGWNHMNGKEALAFARERKSFNMGDNQRIKNQQAVFEAMIKKMTSSKAMVLSYNNIISELDDYFEMSFSSSEIRSLIRFQLAKGPKWKIYKQTIIGGDGSMATYTTGGQKCYVMTQDPTSIANATELIKAVQYGKQLKKEKDGTITIIEEETSEAEDAA